MRQLFLEKGLLKIREVSKPLLDDYFVLVETRYSFIPSGEELARLLQSYNKNFLCDAHNKISKLIDLILQQGGTHARNVLKDNLKGHIVPLGHSCSGRVIAVGRKVKKVSIGDYVACAGHSFANHAEIVCVPEQLLVRLSHEKFLKEASLTGVGTIAMHSIRRANISLGETVCVFGANSLGVILAKLASISGAQVIVLDSSREKLKSAREIGIELTYHLKDDEIQSQVDQITQSYGVDCSFVCPDCLLDDEINLAIDITRKRGRIVFVGERSVILRHDRIQHKEIDMVFALAYGPGRYDVEYEYKGQDYPYPYVRWTENRNMKSFVNLLEDGCLKVDTLVGFEAEFSKFDSVLYQRIQDEGKGVIVSYCPTGSCYKDKEEENKKMFIAARKDKTEDLNVTFFGATRSTKLSVLPVVNTIKGVKIHKIIDRDISYALNAAKMYQGAVALAGDPELFSDDPATDVIYVSSNHLVNIEHVVKALQNGKAVFLQKPFPMTDEELLRLERCLDSGCCNFKVGFSRRYAPFMQKIKQYIDKRNNPLMIQYRLNLGALDDHETLDKRPLHGNIIDKASHVFDLFCFLTGSKPVAVSAETLSAGSENVFSGDNFIVQISMDDGSLCSLSMTSLGHQKNGIERMEVHYDNKTIVMEDFIRLTGYGLPKSFDEVVRIPDKGREASIYSFFENISTSSGFSKRWYTESLKLTMSIDQLVSQGGGEVSF